MTILPLTKRVRLDRLTSSMKARVPALLGCSLWPDRHSPTVIHIQRETGEFTQEELTRLRAVVEAHDATAEDALDARKEVAVAQARTRLNQLVTDPTVPVARRELLDLVVVLGLREPP